MRYLALITLFVGLAWAQTLAPAEAAFIPFPGPQCTQSIQVNQTASTDIKTFTNTGYICAFILTTATAQNINLVTGTGTVCATGIAGLLGGTTAATGPNLAANQTYGAVSLTPIIQAASTAKHLCLLQSGGGQISGTILYTDQ